MTVVSGEILGDYIAGQGSHMTIAGGTIRNRFRAFSGSEVTLIGTEFALDGQQIEGMLHPGDTLMLEATDWETLSGIFADGSPFSFRRFRGFDSSFIDVTPQLKLVPQYDCNADLVVDIADTACAVSSNINDVLAAANLLPGDANGDGKVEFGDFTILSQNFGRSGGYQLENFDRVGGIDFKDFLILSEHFGQQTSAAESAAVPEPSALCLMGSLTAVLALRRRR